ncbi:MAG TPA: hypothetical protein VHT34_00505 [Clostridia bacterium]|nr:hypothetical protein [Clostridia bacterium]
MDNKLEFDSEFCNVKYIEKNNVVFLTWKKFCCLEAYREPTTFALQLLRRFPNSHFIVDARNGFEDVKEDIEWGFSVLLPEMSKTDKGLVFQGEWNHGFRVSCSRRSENADDSQA